MKLYVTVFTTPCRSEVARPLLKKVRVAVADHSSRNSSGTFGLMSDDSDMLCCIVTGICEKFAKVMNHYGIMCTRVPVELELSSCSWLTAAEQSFCSAVVKHSEHAKDIFLHYNLRYYGTDLFVFIVLVGQFVPDMCSEWSEAHPFCPTLLSFPASSHYRALSSSSFPVPFACLPVTRHAWTSHDM